MLLSACAGESGQYPSLAIRDAERSGAQSSAPNPDPVVLSAAQLQRVQEYLQTARASHSTFQSQQASALALSRNARGLSSESDAVARAMIAAAQLSALRGQTNLALSNLDALEADARIVFAQTQPITQAQAQVAEMLLVQDVTLERINQNVSP